MQNSIETRGNSYNELGQPVVTLVQRNQQLKVRATVPTFFKRRPSTRKGLLHSWAVFLPHVPGRSSLVEYWNLAIQIWYKFGIHAWHGIHAWLKNAFFLSSQYSCIWASCIHPRRPRDSQSGRETRRDEIIHPVLENCMTFVALFLPTRLIVPVSPRMPASQNGGRIFFTLALCLCVRSRCSSSASLVSNPDASADVRNTLFRRLCWSELVLCFHVLTFSLESLVGTGSRVLDPGKWLSDVEMHCRYLNLYA